MISNRIFHLDITPTGSLRRRRSRVLGEEDDNNLMDFLRSSANENSVRERKTSSYGSLDRSWARRARSGSNSKKRPDLLNIDFSLERERPVSPANLDVANRVAHEDARPRYESIPHLSTFHLHAKRSVVSTLILVGHLVALLVFEFGFRYFFGWTSSFSYNYHVFPSHYFVNNNNVFIMGDLTRHLLFQFWFCTIIQTHFRKSSLHRHANKILEQKYEIFQNVTKLHLCLTIRTVSIPLCVLCVASMCEK